MKNSLHVLTFLSLLMSPAWSYAATYDVSPNGGPDCNTGVCDLQTALNTAANTPEGDVILMAAGHYNGGGGPFSYFPTIVTGPLELAGDPAGGTILDGSGTHIMSLDTTLALSDNLADITVRDVMFQGGKGGSLAAGLEVNTVDADVSIHRCRFEANLPSITIGGTGGSGLVITTLGIGSIDLTESDFRDNASASTGGGAVLGALIEGNVLVEGNTFVGNLAVTPDTGSAGGLFIFAGLGSMTVNRNLFLNNRAVLTGGAFIFVASAGNATLSNNIISGNIVAGESATGIEGSGGGLLTVFGPSMIITNNTVVGNSVANGDAGGLHLAPLGGRTQADIYNNIVFDNSAVGGVLCPSDCNDILVSDATSASGFNTSPVGAFVNVFSNDFGDVRFQCQLNEGCVPQRNFDASSNLDTDPLLVDPDNGDFRLSAASPLINKGNIMAPQLLLLDFAGDPRIQGGLPDMGALEFAGGTEVCNNNIDDDGDFDIDCLDSDCDNSPACNEPPAPGSENCANNADDDGDGFIDCSDPNCVGAIACQEDNGENPEGSEHCTNNVDDDGDGNIDCNDPECASVCQESGNSQTPGDVTVESSCSLTRQPGTRASLWIFLLPLLFGGMRFHSGRSRGHRSLS